ncbi:MAG: NAD-dependent epimerase/dehydratase family protein [Pyrinomonadaceae bacterium]
MKIIITGGAGFIGSNAASRYLNLGHQVVVVDNLSRIGGARNLEWLRTLGSLNFIEADIRNAEVMTGIFAEHADADRVLHLAGQVAVTTSVTDPRADFEANALGTFNVLEAIRLAAIKAPVIYSSTNKVYGGMEEAHIVERDGRWAYELLPDGVPVEQPLDFHSPYGCSKGAGDQYMRDYHRIYGLNTVVFRQSCIYGYRQFGIEDQGWVAWFMIATQQGRPITVYGDGMQVRDILFIDDLLDAYDAAADNIGAAAGRVYNIGGGSGNVMSLLELLEYLGQRMAAPIPFTFANPRPGDQRVYVSDIRRAATELGWQPKTTVRAGLDLLYDWIAENRGLFA